MDELLFFRRFRLQKNTALRLVEQIKHQLEFDNNFHYKIFVLPGIIAYDFMPAMYIYIKIVLETLLACIRQQHPV
ncbi:unnamed protein product [Acanthoscelides obtectus]|uniref:Uncharacterized protein n=1 Tax=Acanthoscelides obtectus TaxID=200917 RepID=A0A9P0MHU9_ACAOB|nr:unnamed protein product [Acanthoscelides obtectus]CAK1642172.1 hypothetical protein AOBTE_LOCUS12862 [Acanthoscelides obtectus]